jgi:hypothetical protein
LVEEYLSPFKGEPEQIGEEFRWTCYPKRECALAAAERFEAFAIEEKLKGSPDIGMVATKVLEHEGHWAVKARLSVHVERKQVENNCVRPLVGGGGLIRVTRIPGIRRALQFGTMVFIPLTEDRYQFEYFSTARHRASCSISEYCLSLNS